MVLVAVRAVKMTAPARVASAGLATTVRAALPTTLQSRKPAEAITLAKLLEGDLAAATLPRPETTGIVAAGADLEAAGSLDRAIQDHPARVVPLTTTIRICASPRRR